MLNGVARGKRTNRKKKGRKNGADRVKRKERKKTGKNDGLNS